MNSTKPINQMMHFKSAQIAGLEISPNDMAQINQYSLAPLSPEDIFAFKVSMAGNEVDRDFEVFPRATLSKLANLFVGKTVVKDHVHKSDNQIARIYSTELVESHHMHRTKNGEVFTELIAKCYMIKTSSNADLIAEIRAGIRKEVSLGCSIGKAVCSVCGTDNVKTYCTHFGGQQYEGETCFFRLENPQDAYELSFVAIPAQQHAGTVKSYGEKPCYKEDMEAREQSLNTVREILHTRKEADSESLTVHRLAEEARRLMINRVEDDGSRLTINRQSADSSDAATEENANVARSGEQVHKSDDNAPVCSDNAPVCADSAPNEPVSSTSEQAEIAPPENLHTKDSPDERQEEDSRLTVNRLDGGSDDQASCSHEGMEKNRLTVNRVTEQEVPEASDAESCTQEMASEMEEKEPELAAPEEEAKAEEVLKTKQAEVRLRALDLALKLRQQTK